MFAFFRTLVIGNSWFTTNPLIHTQWLASNTFGFFNDVRIFCYRNSDAVFEIRKRIVPHAALISAQSVGNTPKQNPSRMCEANTDPNREYSREPQVRLLLRGWGGRPSQVLTADLTWVFAWDARWGSLEKCSRFKFSFSGLHGWPDLFVIAACAQATFPASHMQVRVESVTVGVRRRKKDRSAHLLKNLWGKYFCGHFCTCRHGRTGGGGVEENICLNHILLNLLQERDKSTNKTKQRSKTLHRFDGQNKIFK